MLHASCWSDNRTNEEREVVPAGSPSLLPPSYGPTDNLLRSTLTSFVKTNENDGGGNHHHAPVRGLLTQISTPSSRQLRMIIIAARPRGAACGTTRCRCISFAGGIAFGGARSSTAASRCRARCTGPPSTLLPVFGQIAEQIQQPGASGAAQAMPRHHARPRCTPAHIYCCLPARHYLCKALPQVINVGLRPVVPGRPAPSCSGLFVLAGRHKFGHAHWIPHCLVQKGGGTAPVSGDDCWLWLRLSCARLVVVVLLSATTTRSS